MADVQTGGERHHLKRDPVVLVDHGQQVPQLRELNLPAAREIAQRFLTAHRVQVEVVLVEERLPAHSKFDRTVHILRPGVRSRYE